MLGIQPFELDLYGIGYVVILLNLFCVVLKIVNFSYESNVTILGLLMGYLFFTFFYLLINYKKKINSLLVLIISNIYFIVADHRVGIFNKIATLILFNWRTIYSYPNGLLEGNLIFFRGMVLFIHISIWGCLWGNIRRAL